MAASRRSDTLVKTFAGTAPQSGDHRIDSGTPPVKTLTTDRLVLRPLTVDDAAFILELLNEPSFLRFIGDKGVRTLEDAREYILHGPMVSYEKNGFGLCLTQLAPDLIPIGICGLLKRDSLEDVDLGFAFLPRFWRRGYASEAASAALAHGWELGLRRIVAITSPENVGSAAVLEKLGFEFEGMVRLAAGEAAVKLFASEV